MGTLRIGGLTLRERILRLRSRADVDEFVRNRGAYTEGRAQAIEQELNKLKRQYGEAAMRNLTIGNSSLIQRAAVTQQIKDARRQSDSPRVRSLQRQLDELVQRANRGY